MNESKIGLTHRLQQEGRWEEASRFKDEAIRRLRAEGLKRSEAQEAAWEAVSHEYPPVSAEVVDRTMRSSWDQLEDVAASEPQSFIEDAIWVYERLEVKDVGPSDAPSRGAWSLLHWAQRNPDRFFEHVMPKVMAADQKAKQAGSQRNWDSPSEWDGADDEGIERLEKLLAEWKVALRDD